MKEKTKQQLLEQINLLKNELTEKNNKIEELQADFKQLSEFETSLNKITEKKEVYALLAEKIREILPKTHFIISGKKEGIDQLGILKHSAYPSKTKKIINLLNYDPMDIKISVDDMSEDEKKLYTSGKFLLLKEGLYELGARKIPKKICKAIEKLLRIEKIYSMGFSFKNRPMGGVTLLQKKGSEIKSFTLIENIIKKIALVTERLEAKEKSKKSEAKYSKLIESMLEGVWQIDKNLKTIYVNKAMCRMLGYTQSEMKGKHLFNFMTKTEIEITKKLIERRKKGISEKHDFKFLTKKGNQIIVLMQTVPIYDNSGNYDGALATVMDITEQKKSDLELIKSRNRFSALINNLQSGVFYVDLNGNILETNPALLKILDLPSAKETKKLNFFKYNPFIQAGYTAKLKKSIKTGKIIFAESDFRSKDDKKIIVNYYFVPIKEKNKVVGVLANITDVTDEREKEKSLKFQSVLLDNIQDYITATDLEGNITYMNQIEKEKFMEKGDDITKYNVSKFGDDEKEGATQQEIIENTRKNGQWRGEVVNFTKNGKKIYLDVRTELLKNENGAPYGMVGISTDITERKKYEKQIEIKNQKLKIQNDEYYALNEELTQSLERLKKITSELRIAKNKAEESNRLKTAFLNNISHEFRTPMNGIIGFSELISLQGLSNEKRKFYAKHITQSCERLLDIVNDTVEISQVQSKSIKIFIKKINVYDILKILVNKFNEKAKAKNIKLKLKNYSSYEDMFIYSDNYKITRVFKHLLNNAFKFTDSGYISITCKKQQNNNIEFIIKDSGIGISPKMQKEVFKPFIQKEFKSSKSFGGSGIGLTLVKSYVEVLGGEIYLKSELGKGTSFYITLPQKKFKNEKFEKNNVFNKISMTTTKKTVLIVEDDHINFKYSKELLELKNITVLFAENGKNAVEICKKNTEIDLILMDIKMPVMDGYQAAQIIKQLRPDISIIAQTAYVIDENLQKKHSDKFDDYIFKPVEKKDFYKIVLKFIE